MNIFLRERLLYEKINELLKKQGFSDDRIALEFAAIHKDIKKEGAMDRETLEGLINICRSCYGLNIITEAGPVCGRGNAGDIDILFVGLMTGSTEEKTGKVFSGPNSDVLMKGMQKAGIGTKDCPAYMHNLVCCQPLAKSPTVKQVNYCTPFLAELMWILDPNIIVTLGSEALSFMLGKKLKIKDYENEPILQGRYLILPIKHPSAIHRIPDKAEQEAAMMQYTTTLQSIRSMNDRIKKLKASKQYPNLNEGEDDGVQQNLFEVCE